MTCCLENLNWRVLSVVLLAHVLVLTGIPALQHSAKPEPPETVLLASLLTLQSEAPAPVTPKPEPLQPPPPQPQTPTPPQAVPPPIRVEPQLPPPVVQIATERPVPAVAQTPVPVAPVLPAAPPELPKPLAKVDEATPEPAKPVPNAAAQARERDEFNAYLQDLIRHLKRHKKYPVSLKQAKIEGKVTLRFTVDAFGRVIASAVSASSGSAELDQAALSMLARANPLPAIPGSLQKDQQTLVVPIEYSLITDR